MFAAIGSDWRTRPWWMNLLFYFCLYMTFIYMPFDMFFKPVAEDEEIWFGFTLYGWWAKATEPLHWLIYGAGAYGFWKMRRWMWPWAAVYAAQVVIAMVVWNILNERGSAVGAGIAGVLFLVLTIALWRAKDKFTTSATPASPSVSAADP
ncbi:MAG: hypothetical protein AAF529_18495 [Pseudomonadota bacterium]